jgi:hypothetical protein
MPEVYIVPQWRMILTDAEFKVILRALRGALRNAEDMVDAEALCDRLSLIRANELRALSKEMDKLEHNVLAKQANKEKEE